MSSSLRDLAVRSLEEAKGAYFKAKRNGYFVFKAQSLLADCESMMLAQRYNDVIQNSNQVLALIEREEDYLPSDLNNSDIAYIKMVIKAANEDDADVSAVMVKVFALDEISRDSDDYTTRRAILEIMPRIDVVQIRHREQWGRFTAMDLNLKMDDLLGYLKTLPKDFIDYMKAPTKELTEHLEAIMNDIRDGRYTDLSLKVKEFYCHYYQFDRFLKEEVQHKGLVPRSEAEETLKALSPITASAEKGAAARELAEPAPQPKPAGPAPQYKIEPGPNFKKEMEILDALALKCELNHDYDKAISIYEVLIRDSPFKNKYIDRREACYKRRAKEAPVK